MFLSRLNAARGSLTSSEIKIADYLTSHLNEEGNITSQQLAKKVGIGQSTIIRFSKKLGFENYLQIWLWHKFTKQWKKKLILMNRLK